MSKTHCLLSERLYAVQLPRVTQPVIKFHILYSCGSSLSNSKHDLIIRTFKCEKEPKQIRKRANTMWQHCRWSSLILLWCGQATWTPRTQDTEFFPPHTVVRLFLRNHALGKQNIITSSLQYVQWNHVLHQDQQTETSVSLVHYIFPLQLHGRTICVGFTLSDYFHALFSRVLNRLSIIPLHAFNSHLYSEPLRWILPHKSQLGPFLLQGNHVRVQ